MQANKAEEATEAARTVHEELKEQMHMRRLYLSLDGGGSEGTSTVLRKQMDDERHAYFCKEESLWFTNSAEYLGDGVKSHTKENEGRNRKGRKGTMNQRMENTKDFENVLECGTKLVTMTGKQVFLAHRSFSQRSTE